MRHLSAHRALHPGEGKDLLLPISRALRRLCLRLECRSYSKAHPAQPSQLCRGRSGALTVLQQRSEHNCWITRHRLLPPLRVLCAQGPLSLGLLICKVGVATPTSERRCEDTTGYIQHAAHPAHAHSQLVRFLSFTFSFTSPRQAAALWGNPPCSLVSGTCWSRLLFEPRRGEQELCTHHSEPLW